MSTAHMVQVMAMAFIFIEAKKRFFVGYAELRSFLCRAKVKWGEKWQKKGKRKIQNWKYKIHDPKLDICFEFQSRRKVGDL